MLRAFILLLLLVEGKRHHRQNYSAGGGGSAATVTTAAPASSTTATVTTMTPPSNVNDDELEATNDQSTATTNDEAGSGDVEEQFDEDVMQDSVISEDTVERQFIREPKLPKCLYDANMICSDSVTHSFSCECATKFLQPGALSECGDDAAAIRALIKGSTNVNSCTEMESELNKLESVEHPLTELCVFGGVHMPGLDQAGQAGVAQKLGDQFGARIGCFGAMCLFFADKETTKEDMDALGAESHSQIQGYQIHGVTQGSLAPILLQEATALGMHPGDVYMALTAGGLNQRDGKFRIGDQPLCTALLNPKLVDSESAAITNLMKLIVNHFTPLCEDYVEDETCFHSPPMEAAFKTAFASAGIDEIKVAGVCEGGKSHEWTYDNSPTCVAKGPTGATCSGQLFCAGGGTFGTLSQQAAAVAEAVKDLSKAVAHHPQCPQEHIQRRLKKRRAYANPIHRRTVVAVDAYKKLLDNPDYQQVIKRPHELTVQPMKFPEFKDEKLRRMNLDKVSKSLHPALVIDELLKSNGTAYSDRRRLGGMSALCSAASSALHTGLNFIGNGVNGVDKFCTATQAVYDSLDFAATILTPLGKLKPQWIGLIFKVLDDLVTKFKGYVEKASEKCPTYLDKFIDAMYNVGNGYRFSNAHCPAAAILSAGFGGLFAGAATSLEAVLDEGKDMVTSVINTFQGVFDIMESITEFLDTLSPLWDALDAIAEFKIPVPTDWGKKDCDSGWVGVEMGLVKTCYDCKDHYVPIPGVNECTRVWWEGWNPIPKVSSHSCEVKANWLEIITTDYSIADLAAAWEATIGWIFDQFDFLFEPFNMLIEEAMNAIMDPILAQIDGLDAFNNLFPDVFPDVLPDMSSPIGSISDALTGYTDIMVDFFNMDNIFDGFGDFTVFLEAMGDLESKLFDKCSWLLSTDMMELATNMLLEEPLKKIEECLEVQKLSDEVTDFKDGIMEMMDFDKIKEAVNMEGMLQSMGIHNKRRRMDFFSMGVGPGDETDSNAWCIGPSIGRSYHGGKSRLVLFGVSFSVFFCFGGGWDETVMMDMAWGIDLGGLTFQSYNKPQSGWEMFVWWYRGGWSGWGHSIYAGFEKSFEFKKKASAAQKKAQDDKFDARSDQMTLDALAPSSSSLTSAASSSSALSKLAAKFPGKSPKQIKQMMASLKKLQEKFSVNMLGGRRRKALKQRTSLSSALLKKDPYASDEVAELEAAEIEAAGLSSGVSIGLHWTRSGDSFLLGFPTGMEFIFPVGMSFDAAGLLMPYRLNIGPKSWIPFTKTYYPRSQSKISSIMEPVRNHAQIGAGILFTGVVGALAAGLSLNWENPFENRRLAMSDHEDWDHASTPRRRISKTAISDYIRKAVQGEKDKVTLGNWKSCENGLYKTVNWLTEPKRHLLLAVGEKASAAEVNALQEMCFYAPLDEKPGSTTNYGEPCRKMWEGTRIREGLCEDDPEWQTYKVDTAKITNKAWMWWQGEKLTFREKVYNQWKYEVEKTSTPWVTKDEWFDEHMTMSSLADIINWKLYDAGEYLIDKKDLFKDFMYAKVHPLDLKPIEGFTADYTTKIDFSIVNGYVFSIGYSIKISGNGIESRGVLYKPEGTWCELFPDLKDSYPAHCGKECTCPNGTPRPSDYLINFQCKPDQAEIWEYWVDGGFYADTDRFRNGNMSSPAQEIEEKKYRDEGTCSEVCPDEEGAFERPSECDSFACPVHGKHDCMLCDEDNTIPTSDGICVTCYCNNDNRPLIGDACQTALTAYRAQYGDEIDDKDVMLCDALTAAPESTSAAPADAAIPCTSIYEKDNETWPYFIKDNYPSPGMQSCVACTCPHGTVAKGNECPGHEASKCTACHMGVDNTGTSCDTCLSGWEPSPNGISDGCRRCYCDHGDAVPVEDCPPPDAEYEDGYHSCVSTTCASGYAPVKDDWGYGMVHRCAKTEVIKTCFEDSYHVETECNTKEHHDSEAAAIAYCMQHPLDCAGIEKRHGSGWVSCEGTDLLTHFNLLGMRIAKRFEMFGKGMMDALESGWETVKGWFGGRRAEMLDTERLIPLDTEEGLIPLHNATRSRRSLSRGRNSNYLYECQGDCNRNSQCRGSLRCFQRNHYTAVPGCSGRGVRHWDYCYNPYRRAPKPRVVNCGYGTYRSGSRCLSNRCYCSHGYYTTGRSCPRHGSHKCRACHGGYRLSGSYCKRHVTCSSSQYKSGTRCYTKQCSCSNGYGYSGSSCPSHRSHKCRSCRGGYIKVGNYCQRPVNCRRGYYRSSSNRCYVNRCKCSGGTYYTGSSCPRNGMTKCRSCHRGYVKVGSSCQRAVNCGRGQYKSNNRCYTNVCTCSNGTGKRGSSCSSHRAHVCQKCNSGYVLKGTRCQRQIFTCKCNGGTGVTGYECLRGKYKCKSCNSGYRKSGTACHANTCTCSNGRGTTHSQCRSHNSHVCKSCNRGYYLSRSRCHINTCVCHGGTGRRGSSCPKHRQHNCYKCNSGYRLSRNLCHLNRCHCSHGTPGTGNLCTTHNAHSCSRCDRDYKLNSRRQCERVCKCEGGVAKTGSACPKHGEEGHCLSCNSGYDLVDHETIEGRKVCRQKVCICMEGGYGAVGDSCPTNGGTKCSTCSPGFRLENDACLENVCTCPNGTEKGYAGKGASWSPDSTGVTVDHHPCMTNGNNECSKCDTGYHMIRGVDGAVELYQRCDINHCKCSGGTPPPDGRQCRQHDINDCVTCEHGYRRDAEQKTLSLLDPPITVTVHVCTPTPAPTQYPTRPTPKPTRAPTAHPTEQIDDDYLHIPNSHCYLKEMKDGEDVERYQSRSQAVMTCDTLEDCAGLYDVGAHNTFFGLCSIAKLTRPSDKGLDLPHSVTSHLWIKPEVLHLNDYIGVAVRPPEFRTVSRPRPKDLRKPVRRRRSSTRRRSSGHHTFHPVSKKCVAKWDANCLWNGSSDCSQ